MNNLVSWQVSQAVRILTRGKAMDILSCGRVDSLEKTDAGRDWGQEEKGTIEVEMAGKKGKSLLDLGKYNAVVQSDTLGPLKAQYLRNCHSGHLVMPG